MEVVAKRAVLLSSLLVVYGVVALVQPQIRMHWWPESWVESALPRAVGDYRMTIQDPTDPSVSYRASSFDYEALKPFGIVARIFADGKNQFDTSVVVGNNKDCFHDPSFCMTGAYYDISNQHVVQLKTLTRGVVPVSVMSVRNDEGKRLVAYTYLGPHGFHPTQDTLTSDWFWTELRLGRPDMGAFYRFMTTSEATGEKNLLDFAAAYLDASKVTSGGRL